MEGLAHGTCMQNKAEENELLLNISYIWNFYQVLKTANYQELATSIV